ncbi:unnamed protein product [Nezara viridula]|uniref:Uncharacterized protein n=1 Tax=Nezara viridula TaxID=85310 RepID=A0A9P0EF02_NEZVI|nr:unnamed protein product [Nezara viridula]
MDTNCSVETITSNAVNSQRQDVEKKIHKMDSLPFPAETGAKICIRDKYISLITAIRDSREACNICRSGCTAQRSSLSPC